LTTAAQSPATVSLFLCSSRTASHERPDLVTLQFLN
jgi:hypothetical protein